MTIKIKTELITLEVKDSPSAAGTSYTNHPVPETIAAIKAAVEQAVILHNAVKNEKKSGTSTQEV